MWTIIISQFQDLFKLQTILIGELFPVLLFKEKVPNLSFVSENKDLDFNVTFKEVSFY